VTVRHRDAETLAAGLRVQDVIVDARGPWLRLCPDVLTTRVELDTAATRLAALASSRP
jgi:hypothetical protein